MHTKCIQKMYTFKKRGDMTSKKIIRVRISKQLQEEIIKEAKKKKKRKSAYAREQIDGQTAFKDTNLDTVYQKLNNEIHSTGLKINYKARLFNTYGALNIDSEIHLLIENIIVELSEIIKLLRDLNNSEDEILSEEEEKKTSSFSLAVDEKIYLKLKSNAKKLKISTSRLIRNRLSNPLKYTKTDILILKKKIHYKIYPIISNIEQICFQYAESNIRNIYMEINQLNNYLEKITKMENEIMFCLQE